MTRSGVDVGGLALPMALLRAIGRKRWKAPTRPQTFIDVFGEPADHSVFYDVPGMIRQNVNFQNWSQEELAKHLGRYEGGVGVTPGLAVLIGDLGIDSPIALDYRKSGSAPRVLYLRLDGWAEVAPDIETLLWRLGIDWRHRAVVQALRGLVGLSSTPPPAGDVGR
ncbi:MAG TPA: hypothetical protein VFC19_17395 [Candidatus Limnocylindrales bacterium]|nr:hypothetical protein [Candidatus Limnocylindrales bacterium]